MFNVIDVNPLRALAKRASDRIPNRELAQRFEKIAFDRLVKDARNFRAARQSDIDNAPAWAREAHARGEELSVYRSNGAGHIFMYGSGDGWGSMYAYECKGCSAGCIEGLRTATNAYHGIRRTGY